MSVIARLEVIPTREGNMSEAIASAVRALDRFDVSYETTPTDTVVEADDPAEVFAAAEAAHRAVAGERVVTSLEVDEHRTRPQDRHDRVAAVERALGRPPRRERRESGTEPGQQGTGRSRSTTARSTGPRRSESRYLQSPQSSHRGGTRDAGSTVEDLGHRIRK